MRARIPSLTVRLKLDCQLESRSLSSNFKIPGQGRKVYRLPRHRQLRRLLKVMEGLRVILRMLNPQIQLLVALLVSTKGGGKLDMSRRQSMVLQ